MPLLLAAGAALPFAADAGTYLVARRPRGLPARGTPPERTPRTGGQHPAPEIGEGLRTLWRDRALRGLCAATLCATSAWAP